jgi:protein-tyrosine-phosphatase
MAADPRRILFVCTGNTCRSPMAEVLFRALAGSADWQVQSAGTGARDGEPAAAHAIEVMAELGLDLSGHRARPVTGVLVDGAGAILAMEPRHADELRAAYPGAIRRIYLLSELAGGGVDGVPDPFGGAIDDYRKAAEQIDRLLRAALSRLVEITGPGDGEK